MAFSLRDNVNVAVVCMIKTNATSNFTSNNATGECVSEYQVKSPYNEVNLYSSKHMRAGTIDPPTKRHGVSLAGR